MELDNLKELWQGLGEKEVRPDYGEHVLSMLRKRSQSPIAKMKRNLFFELMAVLVIYSLTIWYYLVAWSGRYREIAALLFLIGLSFLFYYYRKNKLLRQMQCNGCELRSNLKRQLTTLEKYVRFYFIYGVVLPPVAYYLSGLIIILKNPGKSGLTSSYGVAGSPLFILFLVAGIFIIWGSYLFNRWNINKLYGQHIRKLKELLKEMEEIEDAD